MKFPETLTVTILEQGTNLPIEGLAVVLELFATRKNNYIIGPVVSDSSGQVKFTRDECERSIKADKEMFLMDHIDDLEECEEFLDVRLHILPSTSLRCCSGITRRRRSGESDFKTRLSFLRHWGILKTRRSNLRTFA